MKNLQFREETGSNISSRREFLFGASISAILGAVLGIKGKELHLYIRKYQEVLGLSYIETAEQLYKAISERDIKKISRVPNRISWLHEVRLENISPQEYDLSCELKAFEILLRLNGFDYREQNIINDLPISTNPSEGIHPNLINAKRTDTYRLGQLPPNPYGVHPCVLNSEYKDRVPGLIYTDMLCEDGPFGLEVDNIESKKIAWERALMGNLEAGISTLFWFQAYEGRRSTYQDYPVAEWEHACVAVGYSDTCIWAINPGNLDILEINREGLSDRALAVGGGLMCIRNGVTQPA